MALGLFSALFIFRTLPEFTPLHVVQGINGAG